jgi:excinuclease ABC subunit B
MSKLQLQSQYSPAGDQPQAIRELVQGLDNGHIHQTLLGATGTGKTYTAANVIEHYGKPALIIAHNKTLAAQLAQEYKEFFPNNAVHYFVSYYDYYQPEAYVLSSDTYIEKEAQINEEIERLRHASTQALLTRKDVIIIASVSCIYGLGSPEEYERVNQKLAVGDKENRRDFIRKLVDIYFERTNADLEPGLFRVVGNNIEIMPVNERTVYRIELDGGVLSGITEINALTREIIGEKQSLFIFPAKHFVTPEDEVQRALQSISAELDDRLEVLRSAGKILEAERLKRRTKQDIAMIRETGYCNGVENYSRHFSGRKPGEAPDSLLSYFPKKDGKPDFLTIIDESHVTIPQIGGMYAGDKSRKETLIEHGFRLPSALDNRPLRFQEFEERVGQRIYLSATPGPYEKEHSQHIAEQVIRPTGLLDPVVDIMTVTEDKEKDFPGQIAHFINEAESVVEGGGRVLCTTLTKRMAEDLSEFLQERNIKAEYLHSSIDTMQRIEILTNFRKGEFDVIVGVNLLREGLDLPEVELIGIFDADKEGFLRSETSLIQIIGRAARNVKGRVILYADKMTGSIERAIGETNRRREKQIAYNKKHGITPENVKRAIKDIRDEMRSDHDKAIAAELAIQQKQIDKNPDLVIKNKRSQMANAAKNLDFETAALLRDEIKEIERYLKKGKRKQKSLHKK